MELSKPIQKLIKQFKLHDEIESQRFASEGIKTTKAVSFIAFVYEKFRNVVDYKEDHLLLRNTVQRILNRKLSLGTTGKKISKPLVQEVIWARYIKYFPEDQLHLIEQVIDKYVYLLNLLENRHYDIKPSKIRDWVLGVASTEIERILLIRVKQDAIIELMYNDTLPSVEINDPTTTKNFHNIQIFDAIHKALFKSDREMLRFHLLNFYHPKWSKPNKDVINEVATNFNKLYSEIENILNYSFADKIFRFMRRRTAPFVILEKAIDSMSKEDLQNEEEVKMTVHSTCQKEYRKSRGIVFRAAFRSIVYIFITKSVFALLLEFPYEYYIVKEVHWVGLIINILFPVFIMFFIVSFIRIPGEENTKKIFTKISQLLYKGTTDKTSQKFVISSKTDWGSRSLLFRLIYITAFCLVFGTILFVLIFLKFNIFSIGIFIFFLSLVSLFAYRVRLKARELAVTDDNQGIIPTLFDFLFLPILSVGTWLSSSLSKINVFIFVFDFILEAPIKTLIQTGEEFINFFREKKEEIETGNTV